MFVDKNSLVLIFISFFKIFSLITFLTFKLNNRYDGRSSMARLGISSHLSAGFGDIGFKSNWTLEITVVHPTKIYPNMTIGQMFFHKIDQTFNFLDNRYNGKYTNQVEPQESLSFLDFK